MLVWRRRVCGASISALLATAMAVLAAPGARAAGLSAAKIDSILGRKGALMPPGVIKYGWPRTDLEVRVGKVKIAPALALGSWAAFAPAGDGNAIMIGDLALLPKELNPVVRALQEGGVSVTAVHNHLLDAAPAVLYLHFMGEGDPEKLAERLRAALKETSTPLKQTAEIHLLKASEAEPRWVDEVEKSLGRTGAYKNGVLSVSVARADEVRSGAFVIPPSMGVATALNFQGAGANVASTGDFVMVAPEVEAVISALEQHHIDVTALHSHMLDDAPHLFFMHYWAVGRPAEVGTGLAAALARMHVRPAK